MRTMTAELKMIAAPPAAEPALATPHPQTAGGSTKGDFAAALVEVACAPGAPSAAKPIAAQPQVAPPVAAAQPPLKVTDHAAAPPIAHPPAPGATVPGHAKTTPDPAQASPSADTLLPPPPPILPPPPLIMAATAASPASRELAIAPSASEPAAGSDRGMSSAVPHPTNMAKTAEPAQTRSTSSEPSGIAGCASAPAPAVPFDPGVAGNAPPCPGGPVAGAVGAATPSIASQQSAMAAATANHTTASPSTQVAQVLVKLSAADGTRRISLQLTPTGLGRVDIRLDQPPDGPARITLTAEHPQTLVALQRDETGLSLALDRAGLAGEGRVVVYHLAAALAADAPAPGTQLASPAATPAAHTGPAQTQLSESGSFAGGSHGGSADSAPYRTPAQSFASASGSEDISAESPWPPSKPAAGARLGGLNITA